MLSNYLKITLRQIRKQKMYSLINISGLAIGITVCFLILLFVQDELKYDRYHENADNIYRLVNDFNLQGELTASPIIHSPWGPAIRDAFPEVEAAVRFKRNWTPRLVSYQDKQFYEEKFLWVDPEVWEVFSWTLQRGDVANALSAPYSVVLTRQTAEKYFGDENPVGKTIRFHQQQDYTITGVLNDIPTQSHFHFTFLASMNSLDNNTLNNSWPYTYFLLHEDADAGQLSAQLPAFLKERFASNNQWQIFSPALQHLPDIHLHSHLLYEMNPNGNITNVYIFAVVAFLILLVACFNFMNLATARSIGRAKEVGLRKVLGAYRQQLIGQFLGESLLYTLLALLIAFALVELALPVMNALTGKAIATSIPANFQIAGLLGLFVIIIALLAGAYPAFFLSAFRPINALRGNTDRNSGLSRKLFSAASMRRTLVVLQFSISIFLIIATVVVYSQLDYIRSMRLGFDQEQMLVVPTRNMDVRQQQESIRNTLTSHPDIEQVTFATNMPGEIPSMPVLQMVPEGTLPEDASVLPMFAADYDFLPALNIELLSGRNFSREFAGDSAAFILNEVAAEALFGDASPLGKKIDVPSMQRSGTVVGIVRNFNFNSVHHAIEPMVIHNGDANWYAVFGVKLRPGNPEAAIAFIEQEWGKFAPDLPFSYTFLDDDLQQLYQSEKKIATVFSYFSFLAIVIGCLGLFGLAAFMAEQRTREIGIRKVLGASVQSILQLLSRDFLLLVVFANLIAWPLAWYGSNLWLQDFAFRITPGWPIFIGSGLLALAVAIFSVGFQALKAAIGNPIEALRHE